ncbi:MAG: serpin family protein, partial [Bacteroidales bacterium]|nr:serpin family protein [Bacteroidales bacterium]
SIKMKTLALFLFVFLSIIIFSCKTEKETTSSISIDNSISDMVENSDEIEKYDYNPIINDTDFSDAGAITDFSFKIFKNLCEDNKNENISFSPVSLNIAMGMLYSGARGNTAAEISTVFGFQKETNGFLSGFSNYLKYFNEFAKDTSLDFNLANRIFLENTYIIKDDYRQIIKQYFNGAFKNVDFRHKFKDEELLINSWVSEMTKNRIRNLIPEGTLDENTKMVLVNAIYIKSKWKYPFSESATQSKKFYSTKDVSSNTDFMIQRTKGVRYTEYKTNQVLELPYTTPELSLIIILPRNSDLHNINSNIPSGAEYFEIINNLKFNDVYMEIPKFKIESSFKLAEVLKEMGVKDAFGFSDFSGITNSNELAISEVLQKVFFEIDEKGSEAAAATAIVMIATSSVMEQEMDLFINFIANRPFIYILKENKFNTPLFIGQYKKPENN